MKTRAQKWRSSLALRIPKALAKKAGLWPGAPVELSLVQGSLIIQPICPEPLTLEELLQGVTGENLHGEWHTGLAVGKEIW